MTGERTFPILPCRQLGDVLPFYAALGFAVTYRQERPNPCAVVRREDLELHFFGLPEFDPEQSLGSVVVTVPDPDGLYRAFAEGLRAAYGKVPLRGIPRLLRPRSKQGTVRGFSVVDPGGNWLRVSRTGDREERAPVSRGLARVLEVAARQGDSHGDEQAAIAILDRGLARHPDAPAADREAALVYRAELAIRTGDHATARALLDQVPGRAEELREHLQDRG
jgi:hypothetical protein